MTRAGTPDRADEPAGLYVHVPFCSAICPYCDFAVRAARRGEPDRYLDTLVAEATLWADWAVPIDTVYLGGGTPSILSPPALQRLLGDLRDTLPIERHARLYLEANPEDVTPASAAAWRSLGVATVSLGVQSFVDAELRFLGRRHDAAAATRATATCLETGFDTVSVDLIFGLPEQSESDLRVSLAAIERLAPDHVSCYQLTVHAGTPFARRRERGRLDEMPERDQGERYLQVHRELDRSGYRAYEVSNFATAPEHRSRHNQKYWHHVPYLGLGPSAHSFDGTSRWWNHRDLEGYARDVRQGRRPVAGGERLGVEALALEALMLGLRTADGVDLARYRARFGVDLLAYNGALVELCEREGLLTVLDGRLRPRANGLAVADGLAARFALGRLPDPDQCDW